MLRRPGLPLLAALALAAPLVALVLLPPCAAAPAPVPRKPAVEIVFCIDTTGSMTALVDAAKQRLWSICNQILSGRPMPQLKVGLVAFRDKGDDYVTKVFDLSDDLDAVFNELSTFQATGGGDMPEHVNQALDDAVNKIKWSLDRHAIRVVFLIGDAPPHMEYTDDTKYPQTCAKALDKGIVINAIQCGVDPECTRTFKEIAEKAGGTYVAIPMGGGGRAAATTFDKRLAEINAELVRGTLVYGDAAKREADAKKVRGALDLPPEVAADRVGYLAREGKVARYDLFEAIRAGAVHLEKLRTEELPEALKKLPPKEQRDYLARLDETRGKLLREAHELDRQRAEVVGRKLDKAKASESFDWQSLSMFRRQAARRVRY